MAKATFVNENQNRLTATSVNTGQKITSRVLSRTSGNVAMSTLSVASGLDLSAVEKALDKQIEDEQKSISIEESISKAITDLSSIQQVTAIKELVTSILTKFGLCKNKAEAEQMIADADSEISEATVDYMDSTITALPDAVNNSEYSGIAGRLHSIFRSATENILENSGEGNLFAAVASIASSTLSEKLEDITDDIEDVQSGINNAFNKVNKLFTIVKTGKGNIKDVADIFSTLPDDCLSIKTEVLNLQRLSRNKGFSDYRANSIIDKVASILKNFPDLKIEKADSRNKWDNLSSICDQVQYKIKAADTATGNLINLKNNFMGMAREVKPSSAEYTSIYKDLDKLASSANSFVSFVKNGDSRARTAYNETKYQLNRILVGLARFQKYSKNNNVDKMITKLAKADTKVSKYLSKLDDDVIKPLETVSNCINTVNYAAKFVNRTADKLTSFFYAPDKIKPNELARLETVNKIMENRAIKACSTAMNAINPAAAVVRTFSPAIDEATQTYIETVKQTSSSALQAIENADMDAFINIIKDYTQITLGGQVASALSSFIEKNKEMLTISEIADISALSSIYKAREKQELITHSQTNVAEQREESKEKSEKFINEQLKMQQKKIKELQQNYG